MNRKWSLNSKIYGIMAILICAGAAMTIFGFRNMDLVKGDITEIVEKDARRMNDAQIIKELFLIQVINEKNYILMTSQAEAEKAKELLIKRDEQIRQKLDSAYKISSDLGKKDIDSFKEIYEKWWAMNKEIQVLSAAGKEAEAAAISKLKGRELRIAGEDIMDKIIERNDKNMQHAYSESIEAYERARSMMTLVGLFALVLGTAAAFLVLKVLNKSIDTVINGLQHNSGQVADAANFIASASDELSHAVTEQSASLEETATAIQEMNSMVQKTADNAKKAFDVVESSKNSANRGKEVVDEMIRSIDAISGSNALIMQSVEESNQKISEIVQVIAEIGEKTKVINDIVFQTKLLSFNASVEAARAGEHGKGFAVVAEEVGNLAQMSGNAAKEISDMLQGSIQRVQLIVQESSGKVNSHIEGGKTHIDRGTEVAKECGLVLNEIVENISGVTQMTKEISTASQEQAQGVQEISKAMSQLEQVTQINAATSTQTANSAEKLSTQAIELNAVVYNLIETIKGSSFSPVAEKKLTPKNSNVIPVKFDKKEPVLPSKPLKKVSGADFVPDANDPRFEES